MRVWARLSPGYRTRERCKPLHRASRARITGWKHRRGSSNDVDASPDFRAARRRSSAPARGRSRDRHRDETRPGKGRSPCQDRSIRSAGSLCPPDGSARRTARPDRGETLAGRPKPADRFQEHPAARQCRGASALQLCDPDTASGLFLVEFHPDVDLDFARGLVLNSGVELRGNPDLHPHHLMIRADASSRLSALAMLDEVAYIFPASDNLAKGVPTRACAGAITLNGTTGQFIRTYGDGWDGPGQGAATLTYAHSH